MLGIVSLVGKINRSRLTILLEGETGTGKTLIARAVHRSSDRAAGPFVTLDCAALPETLLESELFGHVKGAFTGAVTDKKGLFEEADGGTILLDEIGKAGLPTQRRLLHFLDKGEVRPVGATTYRKLDVRVICATSNRNLRADVEKGAFLKDLFYRLNDIMIQVPPLRERVEDVALLAEYFLATFRAETRREIAGISRAAMSRLEQYDWPGNVRELEKAVRRAAILCDDGGWITPDLLPPEITGAAAGHRPGRPSDAPPLKGLVEETERRVVRQALEQNGWNKSRAARSLGLSRKGLKNKIQRYGLDRRAR
jgi:DNA-binding NtrC family response regulator